MSPSVPEPRRPEESRVRLSIITQPGDANPFGTIHGGVVLRLADECGAIAALRHARCRQITTAAIDAFTFLGPIYVGELVEVAAEVTHVGRTSVEARVEIVAEGLADGVRRRVGLGYGLYVALGDDGKPCPVPPLAVETDEDRRRDEAARARRAARLARRDEARREP